MMQRWKSVGLPLRRQRTAEEGELPPAGSSGSATAQSGSGSGRSLLHPLGRRRRTSEAGGPQDISPAPGPGTDAAPIVVTPPEGPASGRSREEVLGELNAQYFEEGFDPVSFEIKGLPFELDEALLEEVVQERVSILELLNEKLSEEVQTRSERIVSGVNEVASVEHDLQVAHIVTRNARRNLATALEEVAANTRIAEKTRQKQTLLETLEVLVKLQGVASLERKHREHQDSGDFARAIASSDECIATLTSDADLSQLRVANELADAACDRYRVTMKEMDTALLAVCGDFNEDLYARILDAYKGLPDQGELADKVQACFSKVVDTTVNGVVFSYVMQHGIKFERTASLSELCKQLSSELFRPCLSKVLEVVFDMLASHWRMAAWHEAQLGLQEAQVEALMAGKEAWDASRGAAPAGGEAAVEEGQPAEAGTGAGTPAGEEFPQDQALLEAGARYEVLQVVLGSGLQEGREGVWDAVARCVQQLLNAPGAAEGEHFLQVLDWMHRFIKVGESFSSKNAGWLLRDCLARQSGAFFGAFHRQNLDALQSMLEKEPWRSVGGCQLPSMRETLKYAEAHHVEGGGEQESAEPIPFKEWLDAGNPFSDWVGNGGGNGSKRSRGRSRMPAMQLGFGGMSGCGDVPDRNGGGDGSSGGSPRSSRDGAPASDGDDSEEEPEELRGDFIDEDSQSVRVGQGAHAHASSSGRPDQPTITPTTLKLFKWMVSYGQLMCVLGSASPQVFRGLCDLFDTYLFHIFQTFGNITVAQLADEVNDGGGEEVTPRLRKTLLRIGGYPANYVPGSRASQDMSNVTAIGGSPVAGGGTKTVVSAPGDRWRRSSLFKATRGKLAGMGHAGGAAEMGPMSNTLVSSGNLFALKERSVAVESLMAVAEEFHRAKMAVQAVLPPTETQRLEHFYTRTVDAASDLQEYIFHAASLRLLDLSRYPQRIVEAKYDVTEVGCEQSPWVDPILAETRQFAEKLAVAGVGSATRRLMWDKAMAAAAQTLLEGLSHVKRCTIEGRAAMSLDLQTLIKGMAGTVPDDIDLDAHMRIVDTYIKAFYMPEQELVHWAHTHPEYTRSQLVSLVTLIADNGKWKRKALKDLLAQIESMA